MQIDDELKEVYTLARRAFECQAELGYEEIYLSDDLQLNNDEAMPGTKTASQEIEENNKKNKKNKKIITPPTVPMERSPMGSTVPEVAKVKKFRSLTKHNEAICECTACPLGATRTKFVYGVGNPKAKIMFVGEAPGKDEDEKGEPFVGRAGRLLDDIIKAMGLERSEIYIANILKCRPPQNRDPQPEEMQLCMPYLKEQIRLIKPQFLCALGRIAAHGLLDTTTPLGQLRGRWHSFENIPLLVTYHPAALLRFQKYKRPTWEDMQFLMAEYARINKDQ